jgi:hypothetical protein
MLGISNPFRSIEQAHKPDPHLIENIEDQISQLQASIEFSTGNQAGELTKTMELLFNELNRLYILEDVGIVADFFESDIANFDPYKKLKNCMSSLRKGLTALTK